MSTTTEPRTDRTARPLLDPAERARLESAGYRPFVAGRLAGRDLALLDLARGIDDKRRAVALGVAGNALLRR